MSNRTCDTLIAEENCEQCSHPVYNKNNPITFIKNDKERTFCSYECKSKYLETRVKGFYKRCGHVYYFLKKYIKQENDNDEDSEYDYDSGADTSTCEIPGDDITNPK